MKYIWMLLVSVSVMAVEEVSYSITVTANEKTFTLLNPNFGRGDGQWTITRTYSAEQLSTAPVANRISPPLSIHFPYNQEFTDYNASQSKPLFAQKNVRYVPVLGALNISRVNGENFKYTRPSLHFVGSETCTYSYFDCLNTPANGQEGGDLGARQAIKAAPKCEHVDSHAVGTHC